MTSRQPHPDLTKSRAKAIYEARGSRQAAEVLGISRRTVNQWAKAEGWQRRLATGQPADQGVAPVADANEATAKSPVATGYQVRRHRQLDRYGELVDAALDKAEQAMEANRPYHAKAYAVAAGVFTDKAEVLAKAAGMDTTAGRPDPAVAAARIGELVDVIEGRVAGA